jgi:hypothetical protein
MKSAKGVFFMAAILFLGSCAYGQEAKRVTGVEFLPREQYRLLPQASEPVAGRLPGSATLEDYFPKSGNQGNLLSCTAWATTYSKAYRIFQALGDQGTPDNQRQSPAFVYSAVSGGKCRVATTIPAALNFLRAVGSVYWTELPYSEATCPEWRSIRQLARNNSYIAYRLSDNPDRALASIRNLIVGGDPVIAAIYACDEFQNPVHGQIKSPSGSDASCSGHAVLVVGFDDQLQAVRILNSWGDQWGESGRAWMSYPVFKKRLVEAYVDYGPGQMNSAELSWLEEVTPVGKAASPVPAVTPDVLVKGLRTNIDPRILARQGVIEGEPVNISIWSIWLNLAPIYLSQIDSVDYYFLHWTFKHNPQRSLKGSSVFLAQWRGYGCTDEAYLIAKLKDGTSVRTDFNFCEVAKTEMPDKAPK